MIFVHRILSLTLHLSVCLSVCVRNACWWEGGAAGAADWHHSGCFEEKPSAALLSGLSWYRGDLPIGCRRADGYSNGWDTVQSSPQVQMRQIRVIFTSLLTRVQQYRNINILLMILWSWYRDTQIIGACVAIVILNEHLPL